MVVILYQNWTALIIHHCYTEISVSIFHDVGYVSVDNDVVNEKVRTNSVGTCTQAAFRTSILCITYESVPRCCVDESSVGCAHVYRYLPFQCELGLVY